ncbi:uncharacterized protein LOC114274236 [Camellia sinensis]|uniref:uncharacterized protein LOC114274236 n=1 Tax=Camellia sinensis TaxID=4442 RepID=UPI00103620DA|nr:uncharacterized protein LOC114274236 [Camellia sinensis]
MGRPKPVAKDLLASIPSSVDEQPTQTLPPPKPKRIKKAQPKAKAAQRRSESQPPESQQPKKLRSSSATTSGSKKPDAPRAPTITLEDKLVMTSDSADDINVGIALSAALLLPGDLERNAQYSEYESYALMLQHSVQKAEVAEAIRKVVESQKREAEEKMAQAEKEFQEALATKDAEIKEANEKAYSQGMADVTEAYELQVKQRTHHILLPFPPPPPPTQSDEDSESGDEEDNDALVRKAKEVTASKSLPSTEQVLDLTQDEEGDVVVKETTPEQASSDVPVADKSIDESLAQIDAELAMEKAAEMALPESSEVQTQVAVDADEP